MSKTFDLSTLNLSAGTHRITVKARASGYTDSPASDPVSYVVEGGEITFTIDGTSYTALSGMTWAEWCDSEYNTGGFYIGMSSGYQNVIINGEMGTSSNGEQGHKAVVYGTQLVYSDYAIESKTYEFYFPGYGGGSN